MKNFVIGSGSRFSSHFVRGAECTYVKSSFICVKKKLFVRKLTSTSRELKWDDKENNKVKVEDINPGDDIYIQKQKDFLRKFDEENTQGEDYTTVRIENKNDQINSEFMLNNEKYVSFIKKYNNVKVKKSRFSKNAELQDSEKSLWEILKEKEDYLKNKKKMKTYQKELDHKMEREYEKIKKEENYIELDQNREKNQEQMYNHRKHKGKKKRDIESVHDDIDMFLRNDETYVNDIKSYDEIYDDSRKCTSTANRGATAAATHTDAATHMDAATNTAATVTTEDGYVASEKQNLDKDDLSVHNMIEEEMRRHATSYGDNGQTDERGKRASEILINDLNSKDSSSFCAKFDNSLFVNEVDDITAKKCIGELFRGEEKGEKVDPVMRKNLEKVRKDEGKEQTEEKNVVEVKPAEIVERISGENLSTIIDENIDNLIIQREIKREKTVSGVINVVYSNLHNCDAINLSSALLKISKLIDSYQKQSIIKNYMYMCIIKKIEEKLSTFEISNLVQIFYAFVKIDHLPFFFNDIINNMNSRLNEAEPKQLCSILYTLSNIIIETNESRNFKNKIIDIVKRDISSFVCLNDVICLLTSLSKLKYKDVNIYYELSKKIENNLDQLTIKNVSNILWSFSNINYTSKLVKNVKKIIEKNIHNAHYLDIINLIYSLTKLNEYDDHLFNEVFYNAVNIYLHNMSVKNLCIILWSYTYANVDKPDLYINILTKINENMKQISTKDIVSILTCLSRIKYNYRYKYLYNHLKNKVIKNLYAFTPLQLTNVIYYSSFLDIYDHKYYYLLVQQIYDIRKLLYLENLTLILYALKNISYLNVQNRHVFNLICHILEQIKKKYKLLCGEDCVNIMLILEDLKKYTHQGYLSFSHIDITTSEGNGPLDTIPMGYVACSTKEGDSSTPANETATRSSGGETATHASDGRSLNNYMDIFDEGVHLNQLEVENEEDVYLPYINDLLYEQIKIRLNNFWHLNIKDVNNLLIIMKNSNMYDDVILNMIMRQIVPVLLKSSNIEFLIFLSNIASNKNLKFIALTHMSRRPKLISVFKKKINSITSSILANFQVDSYIHQDGPPINMYDANIGDYTSPARGLLEETKINTDVQAASIGDSDTAALSSYVDTAPLSSYIDTAALHSHNDTAALRSHNDTAALHSHNDTAALHSHNDTSSINCSIQHRRSRVDLNSCVALCYACFNIHYEDDNILKLYDVVEHMIIQEKKPINSVMLINYIYILTLTNNKIALASQLAQEYTNNRYHDDMEKMKEKITNNDHQRCDERDNLHIKESHHCNLSFNLFYEENDKLSTYVEKGDKETSLILLKLLYINILLNKYNYMYHMLSEICKYSDNFYTHEFLTLSKQVCYYIYNFCDFFCKNKDMHYTWIKVHNNVYINDEHIYLELNYERTNINLINADTNNRMVNQSFENKKISKTLDNNLNIATFFYNILNYNLDDMYSKNTNSMNSKKERKKVKMFHFDHIISDVLNFVSDIEGVYTQSVQMYMCVRAYFCSLNVQYKGSHVHENIYKICCSFPYERHLIDLISYEVNITTRRRSLPITQATAVDGPAAEATCLKRYYHDLCFAFHSVNFRDLYNSIKDKNVICYIFNIIKKIKKDLRDIPNNAEKLEEKEFWENLKYATP
ncbi:hypothetical protein POVWA2_036480 [Plasmodium ovale wallikeri]|uniref:RNA-editing substrate-binding complex 6 protein domain-containing protein n=1 Tax=Plasmodium ovale wallikeri TaxID=864142 RepID=A0A1A8Z4V2_PLAOA|nr:hypothetical protein POVWA2_036480 [Plasmodium ovale wallikeri]